MELNSFKSFFSNAYMPHGHCYLWQEHILWTNVISDLIIATSYFSIPIAILIFANKRKDVGYHWLFLLFSAFILLCGITHLFGIYTVWHGTYGIHGLSKAMTAAVSLITALYLFKLIPEAVKLPTIGQFEGVQAELRSANKESAELKNQLAVHNVAQFMLNAHPAGTLLIDENLKILFCNPALLQELREPSSDNLIGMDLSKLVVIDDPAASFDSIRDALTSAESSLQNILCLVKTADNQTLPMQMSLVRDKLDDQDLILITFLNLSKQRFAERQLVEYHKRMERVIDATEDGIWEWYVKENRVVYSPTLMDIIGKSHISKPSFEDWFTHIHPDYQQTVMDAINQHFQTKQKYQVEYLGLNKNNEYAWFSTIGNSLFDEQGEAIVMSGSLRNIQNSKLLERQVQEKTEILEAIYHGSSQAIWLLKVENNHDFIFLEFNPTAAQRSGIPTELIINKRIKDLANDVISEELATQLEENYQRCLMQKVPIEYTECIPLQGQPRWYQTTLYPLIENGNVTKIVGAAIDITARIIIEEQLHDNQTFLEKMINSAVCGLYLFDLNKRQTIRINQRFTDILGYDLAHLQAIEQLEDCYHQDDLEQMTTHWQQVKHSNNNGELQPVKYRFKHQQGHWVWCYCVNTALTFNKDNSPATVLGTFVDITEQTQLLLKLQESNAHLEQFAFIASHDLQEPLRKITAFSDSLNTRLAKVAENDEKVAFELSRLIDAASRMRTMIQDLLKLSRIHSSGLTQTNTTLKKLITDVKEQLSYAIEESRTEIACTGQDIELYLDHSLFIQALQNLITNSIKFRTANTAPYIEINVKKHEQTWLFTYKDNGIGIASEFREQIFEPFRRLNAQTLYPGSGMGLAICKQIIKQHGGHIQCVEPDDEIGAQFEFFIPIPARLS